MKYVYETSPDEDAALLWCLAAQQAANPDEAPADTEALFAALVVDRLAVLCRQCAESQKVDLKAAIDTADAETLAAVKATLGLDA